MIENVKKDTWKWFVAMTLRSSRFELKNDKCIIYASNDFNFQKLNTTEIKSYLNGKTKDLFGFWYDMIIENDKGNKSDLLWDASDIF